MKNLIVINEKYAIGSNTNFWIIYRPVKPDKARPHGWKAYKYLSTLDSAIQTLKEIMLRTSGFENISDLQNAAKEINELFKFTLDSK